MRFLIFLVLLAQPLFSQDFDKILGQVKGLKNSQYPKNRGVIEQLQNEAKTDFQKNLAGYHLSVYYTQISEYDSALNTLEKIRPGFDRQTDQLELGKTYRQAGMIYYSFLNDFVKGKAYLDSAKTFFDSRENRTEYIDCIRHEATIYYMLGDIDRSNQLLIKILPEYEKGSLKYLDIEDLIVNNLIAESNYESAYEYSRDIPESYLKIKETRRYAYSLMIRGFLQKKLGMYQQAETNLLRSIELSVKNEYRENMVDNNRFLGMLYTETNEFSKAEHYLNDALKYCKEIGDTYSMMHVYASLSRHYIASHDFEKGDYYANEATAMGDSLFKEENNQNLAEYEAKFKTAEKEVQLNEAKLEIARKRNWIIGLALGLTGLAVSGLLLWRINRIKTQAREQQQIKNREIEDQQRLISAREIERKRIAKELHDSVGAQLTVVSTSLDNAYYLLENKILHTEKLENISNEVRLAAQSLRDTIWATNHSSISVLELNSRLQELIKKFVKDDKVAVETHFSGEETMLSPIEGLNLFRIAQEALNNVKKHAQASEIKLSGNFSGGVFSLIISDNGIGFNLDSKNALSTFGLNNMKFRAEELGATLEIDSQTGAGTRVLVKRG